MSYLWASNSSSNSGSPPSTVLIVSLWKSKNPNYVELIWTQKIGGFVA